VGPRIRTLRLDFWQRERAEPTQQRLRDRLLCLPAFTGYEPSQRSHLPNPCTTKHCWWPRLTDPHLT
ncbi:unnamed protein product, partial [Tetraodon nigroviridis]